MSWEYAELSKAASKAGGATKYVELLIESGKKTGHIEMIPFLLAAVGAGYGFGRISNWYKQKKSEKEQEVENAKQELIKAINDCTPNLNN